MTTEAPSTRAANGWSSLSPYPWRRWAARLADGILLGGLFWFIVPVAIAITAPDFWFAIEPILYEPWFPYIEGMISIAVLIPVYEDAPAFASTTTISRYDGFKGTFFPRKSYDGIIKSTRLQPNRGHTKLARFLKHLERCSWRSDDRD